MIAAALLAVTPGAASAQECGAIIDNGTIMLGVNCVGHLNLPFSNDPLGIGYMGLRYLPTGGASTEPGCQCEGWGVADPLTNVAGYANVSSDNGIHNIDLISFESTPSTARSVVEVRQAHQDPAFPPSHPVLNTEPTFRVTHDYHPSAISPYLYEVEVTVTNISAFPVNALYRRVMDWDVYPTPFDEFVTIVVNDAQDLYRTDTDGFNSSNPFSYTTFEVGPPQGGNLYDTGPGDIGALFDFDFGLLSPGASKTFRTFYGAAGSELAALTALGAIEAEAYSLGQPNCPGGSSGYGGYGGEGSTSCPAGANGPNDGTPNTFIFAFGGIGGSSAVCQENNVETPTCTEQNPCVTLRNRDLCTPEATTTNNTTSIQFCEEGFDPGATECPPPSGPLCPGARVGVVHTHQGELTETVVDTDLVCHTECTTRCGERCVAVPIESCYSTCLRRCSNGACLEWGERCDVIGTTTECRDDCFDSCSSNWDEETTTSYYTTSCGYPINDQLEIREASGTCTGALVDSGSLLGAGTAATNIALPLAAGFYDVCLNGALLQTVEVGGCEEVPACTITTDQNTWVVAQGIPGQTFPIAISSSGNALTDVDYTVSLLRYDNDEHTTLLALPGCASPEDVGCSFLSVPTPITVGAGMTVAASLAASNPQPSGGQILWPGVTIRAEGEDRNFDGEPDWTCEAQIDVSLVCQSDLDCDDGDLCSLEACDPTHREADLRGCVKTPKCTATDQCQAATCEPLTGACGLTDAPNGKACNDGSACTTTDACHSGACTGVTLDCSAPDDCHEDGVCDPAIGCVIPTLPDGTTCDDRDICSGSSTCVAGSCTGADPITCPVDQCHAGACHPLLGCLPVGEGTACDDGDLCTVGDACFSGSCGGEPRVCEASDQCHLAGTCDPGTGECSNPPAPTCCGDGTPAGSEECDDGNLLNGDGCTASCTIEICGNGILDAGEQCDDGNATHGDGCDSACHQETCGDGFQHPDLGEECDDGNTTGGDGCGPGCLFEECGNSFVDPGETCDDGNLESTDGCSSSCTVEICGDGTYQPGAGVVSSLELAWLGTGCGGVAPSISVSINGSTVYTGLGGSTTCSCDEPIRSVTLTDPAVLSLLRDGDVTFSVSFGGNADLLAWAVAHIDGRSTADVVIFDAGGGTDAETRNPDLCRSVAEFQGEPRETTAALSGFGEECDDGNTISGDGCSDQCEAEVCQNSRVDFGEECDDGNDIPDDNCDPDCTLSDRDDDGVDDVDDNCVDLANPDQVNTRRHSVSVVVTNGAYLDLLEADGYMALDNGSNDGHGALQGSGVSFACGTCDVADFSNPATQIGNGDPLCGYTSGIPRQIVQHQDTICARVDSTGSTFELVLRSFLSDSRSCVDATGGATCAATNGHTSYDRVVAPDTGDLCDCSDGDGICGGDYCDASSHAKADTDCAYCGDGEIQAAIGEECDDSNAVSGDGCDSACLVETCGNGRVEGNEQCDDGGTVSGDGCEADCLLPDADDDGVPDGDDNCPDVPNPGQENTNDQFVSVTFTEEAHDDPIEGGASIYPANQCGGGAGPLYGNDVDFDCGPCDEATFASPVGVIGSGTTFCGFSSEIPRELVMSQQVFCARILSTGAKVNMRLDSFQSCSGNCWDADGGATCALNGGHTTYVRDYLPDPGDACDCLDADGVCIGGTYCDGSTQELTDADCVFECLGEPDGTPCDDDDACTLTDTCQAGVCTGGAPVECVPSDGCHDAGSCDPGTGVCSDPAREDGSSCSDDNACTEVDTCQAGTCVGASPVVCVAADQCHDAGTCDSATGACSNPAKVDGTACDDGDACTRVDACQAGACAGGDPVTCTASDQCHDAGTCDPLSGLCTDPVKADGTECSDGDACTQVDTCQAGACTGANPVTCAASDQCHEAGTCDPGTGACSNPARPDGSGCSDGDACTQVDTCQAGACAGSSPVTCSASDQCHDAGTCDPETGACSDPAKANGTPCDDNDACSQIDTCQSGTCEGSSPVTCSASDQCHEPGTCDPGTGLCSNPPSVDGMPCDDQDACTEVDLCTAGTCVGAAPVVCTAIDQCHDAGSCDPATGACSTPARADGTACSDGDACTQVDTCQAGACLGGSPVLCAEPDQCHDAGSCDPLSGTCTNPERADGTTCDDGDECTFGDSCVAGACAGAAICNVCGNGFTTGIEECDDGNTTDGDGCDSNCTLTACGNGVTAGAEECDDANLADADGCDSNCTNTACGNGIVTGGESCDDGNFVAGDGCDFNCTPTSCGNGVMTGGEGCEDGNLADGDGCDSNCTPTGCGNGIPTAGETCDDGNTADGDGCDSNCAPTGCGNGVVTAGETCDDGNTTDGDGCDSSCAPTGCGNGVVTAGETCDDGNLDDGDGCDSNCTPTACGNGIVSSGEGCDDGNTANGDGCDSNCTFTGCGNGIATDGELCDDGNLADGDGCDNNCTQTSCGNGVLTGGEQCDDGNLFDGDGCDSNCTLSGCGNGVTSGGEQCDDGNLDNGDGCDSNCTLPGCGNGVASGTEACDDGNTEDGDGCDSNCTPTGCGNAVATFGEACDDGNLFSGDGCDANCTPTGCGNGVLTDGELCDDGNAADGDGCDSNCTFTTCGNGVVTDGEECDDGNTASGDGCEADCTLPAVGSLSLSCTPSGLTVRQGENGTLSCTITPVGGFSGSVTPGCSNLPTGVACNFFPSPVTVSGGPGTVTVTVIAGTSATVGNHTFDVTATGGAASASQTISLTLPPCSPASSPVITAPANGATGVALSPTLSWLPSANAVSYALQVATDPTFTNVLRTFSTPATSISVTPPLLAGVTYYWRIGATTVCGTRSAAPVNSFTTSSGTVTNIVGNGDFESGSTVWTTAGAASITNSAANPAHDGSWYGQFGGTNGSISNMIQTVTIPAGATTAYLQYWFRVSTTETTFGCRDYLYVQLRDPVTQAPLASLQTVCNSGNLTGSWRAAGPFDVSAFAGRSVILRFFSTNDAALPTTFFVDDVVLNTDGP